MAHRNITFDRRLGLLIADASAKINLVDAQTNGDVISADDLYGSTVEIETFTRVHRLDEVVENNLISLEEFSINLPGNRTIVINGSRFNKTQNGDTIEYRFALPKTPEDFERLLSWQ